MRMDVIVAFILLCQFVLFGVLPAGFAQASTGDVSDKRVGNGLNFKYANNNYQPEAGGYQASVLNVTLNVPLFNQNDDQWRNDQLGTCPNTYMGTPNPSGDWHNAAGCTTTCKAMVFNYFSDNYTDPKKLNRYLTDHGGYVDCPHDAGCCCAPTADTNIGAPPGVIYAGYVDSNLYSTIDEELKMQYPVMAAVQGPHFVVIVGKQNDTYIINDPWGGIQRPLGAYKIVSLRLYHKSPWPMFLNNLSHTGRSPYLGPQTDNIVWTYSYSDPGNLGYNSPVIGQDGTIYIGGYVPGGYGTGTTHLVALDKYGGLKWSFPNYGGEIMCIPAVGADGAIYFATSAGVNYNGLLYCINAKNGTPQWSRQLGFYQVGTGLATDSNGRIYVTDSIGERLRVFNSSGTDNFTYILGARSWSSPAITAEGTAYVGQDEGTIYAIDPDGSLKWSRLLTTGTYMCMSPAIRGDGIVYIAGWNKYFALNPADGTDIWPPLSCQDTDSIGFSPVIAQDGSVYMPSRQVINGQTTRFRDRIYKINANGTTGWFSPYFEGEIVSSPAIGSDGTLYFGCYDNCTYAMNPIDGTIKWSYKTGGPVTSSPCITADGTLIVASNDGYLYAFGPARQNACIFRQGGSWYTDINRSGSFEAGKDTLTGLFGSTAGDIPLAIDWDGDGVQEMAVFRTLSPNTGKWYIDLNHNGNFDPASEPCLGPFGTTPGDIPLAIDWDGDGKQELAIFRTQGPNKGYWYIDTNRNGKFQPGVDLQLGLFGTTDGDIPVAIDWDGDGKQELAIFRPSTATWYIDTNRNGRFDPGVDLQLGPFGKTTGDIPLAIDWDGDSRQEMAIFRPSTATWYIDYNRNGQFDPNIDSQFGPFGQKTGDIPLSIKYGYKPLLISW